uniref:Uncharacterized protein n=1 Tax=Anguilla anguilla TaxID=7936 RepID=A0A0E9QFC4_ANGAN
MTKFWFMVVFVMRKNWILLFYELQHRS